MRSYKYIFGLLLLILLTHCNMVKYRDYEEIHEHTGNKKYEVVSILKQNYKIRETLLDGVKNQLIVNVKTTPIKEEDIEYR